MCMFCIDYIHSLLLYVGWWVCKYAVVVIVIIIVVVVVVIVDGLSNI